VKSAPAGAGPVELTKWLTSVESQVSVVTIGANMVNANSDSWGRRDGDQAMTFAFGLEASAGFQ
jgi:hypothetical protein